MPNGSTLDASPGDWFGVVQFLYRQIDGPPPQSLDVTSKGEKITGFAVVSPDDWDNEE